MSKKKRKPIDIDKIRNPRPLPEELRDYDLNGPRFTQKDMRDRVEELLKGVDNIYLELLCSDENNVQGFDKPFVAEEGGLDVANRETGEVSLPSDGELKMGDLCDKAGVLINTLIDDGARPEDGTLRGDLLVKVNQIRIEVFKILKVFYADAFKKPKNLEIGGEIGLRMIAHALRPTKFFVKPSRYLIEIDGEVITTDNSEIDLVLPPNAPTSGLASRVKDFNATITKIEKGDERKLKVEVKFQSLL